MGITRRNFIRLGVTSLLGIGSYIPNFTTLAASNTGQPSPETLYGRVTRSSIPVYQQPDMESPKVTRYKRDKILHLEDELFSPDGPANNPHWYRVSTGYVHSAYIQRIENIYLNQTIPEIPLTGTLGRITVPFTQSWRINKNGHWKKLYRLYYGSLHCMTGLVESPDGKVMAQISDEVLKINYFAPIKHIQPLDPLEYMPISPELPAIEKKLFVSLADQTLTATVSGEMVFRCKISSGVRYMETPTGQFHINRKYPSRHMGNGGLTSEILAYELPGVPWVSFFGDAGVAFHGTFWHDNFGTPMSKGCINMQTEDAKWLFRWTNPEFPGPPGKKSSWSVVSQNGVGVSVY